MKALRRDLANQKRRVVKHPAGGKEMAQSVLEDYEDWCKTQP